MEVCSNEALDFLLRHRLDGPSAFQHPAHDQVHSQVLRLHEETRSAERQGWIETFLEDNFPY